jgi:hypothetical protein
LQPAPLTGAKNNPGAEVEQRRGKGWLKREESEESKK